MDKWQEKRILILGKTYPSHSKKYTEIVCTGGIEEATGKMVRLHPVPIRYMEAGQQSKFQWIRARVTKHESDPRPESYRLDRDSIVLEQKLANHDKRREILENSPHLIRSVEQLKQKQLKDGTSLGIVKPKDILECSLEKRPASERCEWDSHERARLDQERLFGDKPKPLDFPEMRFMVNWRCDDADCEGHQMGISEWGIHELYRKLRTDPDCERKILEMMQKQLNEGDKEIYLFLGNYMAIQYNFGLMDSYSAPKAATQSDPEFSLFR